MVLRVALLGGDVPEVFGVSCSDLVKEQKEDESLKELGEMVCPAAEAVRKPGASSPPCYATPGRHGGIPVSRGQRMVRGPIMGPFLKGGGCYGLGLMGGLGLFLRLRPAAPVSCVHRGTSWR
uniref:Uncharacterized protein n=1 Tax=Knipowitschia caucasica TaxID=637954 RepID=A0AAV2LLZ3_KNICA